MISRQETGLGLKCCLVVSIAEHYARPWMAVYSAALPNSGWWEACTVFMSQQAILCRYGTLLQGMQLSTHMTLVLMTHGRQGSDQVYDTTTTEGLAAKALMDGCCPIAAACGATAAAWGPMQLQIQSERAPLSASCMSLSTSSLHHRKEVVLRTWPPDPGQAVGSLAFVPKVEARNIYVWTYLAMTRTSER